MFDEANSFLETNDSIQWSTQNKLISNAIKKWHSSNKTDLLEFGINKLMSFSLESNLLVGDLHTLYIDAKSEKVGSDIEKP